MEDTNMSMFTTPNNFVYSAVPMTELGATEYSLVNILVDVSGSVGSFKNELDSCLKTIIESCKKHPRSGNLLVRVATFNSSGIKEIHGFVNPSNVDITKYDTNPMGGTPLFDAMLDSVETAAGFAKTLYDSDYMCNLCTFVCTDGDDNESRISSPAKIKTTIEAIKQSESVESIKTILIGVNDGSMSTYLNTLMANAGFDEYISIGDATPGKLAKLAQWISQSISSTSQALGTGGASQNISFTI